MVKDFTLDVYNSLCKELIKLNFTLVSVDAFLNLNPLPKTKYAIIRHDVDRIPLQALKMAEIEHRLGISSSYYFRIIDSVFKEDIISSISALGHEIGYHYEVLAKNSGNFSKAIEDFEVNLNRFRKIVPVNTICMHGSPLSHWRDYDLWREYDFEKFGIKGEAFLTLNYNKILYFTDTGRTWNNQVYNVRDKVSSNLNSLDVNSTTDLIRSLPNIEGDISINTHPHRWHDTFFRWYWELISQNIKNIGKRILVKRNNEIN